jgi:hypothetical protein
MNRFTESITTPVSAKAPSRPHLQVLRLARYVVVASTASGILACQSPTNQGDLIAGVAVVYGRVVAADGRPVSQAVLHPRAYATCAVQDNTTVRATGSDRLVAASDGSYRDLLSGAWRTDGSTDYCIVVAVDAQPSMGLGATSGTAVVRFVRQPPYDSVRVDIIMR